MAGTLTASIIRNDTTSPPVFQNSANTEIGTLCRAWVNFNGTTSPGTIRASFNVSSVTKNGTGDYTLNFTNALADANYSSVFGADNSAGLLINFAPTFTNTSSTLRIKSAILNGNVSDASWLSVAVFR